MKKIIYLLSSMYVLTGTAQNYREDLLAMNRNVLGRESYSLQLNYSLYADNNLINPVQQREVKVVRSGENLHVKHNKGIEVIETEKMQLIFNHENRVFSTTMKEMRETSAIKQKKEMLNLFGTYVDTLINVFESVKVIYQDDTKVKYECKLKSGKDATMVWLEVDKKLKIYRSITTQYKEKQKIKELDDKDHTVTLKIEYKGFTTNPVLSPALFELKNYVVLDGQRVSGPAKKYNNYTYLNATP